MQDFLVCLDKIFSPLMFLFKNRHHIACAPVLWDRSCFFVIGNVFLVAAQSKCLWVPGEFWMSASQYRQCAANHSDLDVPWATFLVSWGFVCFLHAEGFGGFFHPSPWKELVSNLSFHFTAVAGLYQQLFWLSFNGAFLAHNSSCQFLETFVSKRLFLAAWWPICKQMHSMFFWARERLAKTFPFQFEEIRSV